MTAYLKGFIGSRTEFSKQLKKILGFRPKNEYLYELAFRHSSMPISDKFDPNKGNRDNQRLEYLGDAVLGAVVADVLFHKFPSSDEGHLSNMRSKIVNRRALNLLAKRMRLPSLLKTQKKGLNNPNSIYGDALEALIGAIFLDKGFRYCDAFIRKKIFDQYVDLEALCSSVISYKSLLHEWSQKTKRKAAYEIVELGDTDRKRRTFEVTVKVDGEEMVKSSGFSKKSAEEKAAKKMVALLKISPGYGIETSGVGDGK